MYLTRRQYNDSFEVESPETDVPEAGEYIWDWYFDIDARISRVWDGVCRQIPPSDWLAWQQMTGHIVNPVEFDILATMDRAYVAAVNEEFEAARAMEKPKDG